MAAILRSRSTWQGLTESQKAKQRYVLEDVENFFALAKNDKAKAQLRRGPRQRIGYQTADERTRHATEVVYALRPRRAASTVSKVQPFRKRSEAH